MKTRRQRNLSVLIWTVLVLLVLRLCLALIIKTTCNHILENLNGYRGHIEKVHVALWRGAYQFRGVRIERTGGKVPLPLFAAPRVDIGLGWRALFRGHIVATVVYFSPRIHFVLGPRKEQTQSGREQNWVDAMEALVPVKIDHLEVRDGEVHFNDPYTEPVVDLMVRHLEATADNLNNSRNLANELQASVSATAQVLQNGKFAFFGRLAPLARTPTFEMSMKVEGLDLPELNQFLLHYAGVDVRQGRLDLYTEASAARGHFQGYVKPLVRDLKVMSPEEKDPLKLLKKTLAGITGWIFKNRPADQQATKVEFSGDFQDPHPRLWPALVHIFENAFIKAIPPGFENSKPDHKKSP